MTDLLTKHITWDLSDLYQSPEDNSIEESLKEVLSLSSTFEARYKGKINALSSQDLLIVFNEYEALMTQLYKVAQYSSLEQSIDTQNIQKALVGRVDDISTSINLFIFV